MDAGGTYVRFTDAMRTDAKNSSRKARFTGTHSAPTNR
jgi:hypothetical protein